MIIHNEAPPRWQNQEEALQFALQRPATMLNMDMGTGKTRVTIDYIFRREDVRRVLVVCPKAVIPVWRTNLEKFAKWIPWLCWDEVKGTIAQKAERIKDFIYPPGLDPDTSMHKIVVVNYDIVWRQPLGELLRKLGFDLVVLDESHRAKSPGSKVSKYLGMIGKATKYRLCLSGTPMANSPLDVYGQYRFLDPSIFGTRYNDFRDTYAVLGGPEHNFVVGFKNLQQLNEKFQSIAYTCKMSDVADRLKLPDKLPPNEIKVQLPAKDRKLMKDLNKEFIAECEGGFVVLNNVLNKVLRMQQICSGYVVTQENPLAEKVTTLLNTTKEDALYELLTDIDPSESLVVFCVFTHDLMNVAEACNRSGHKAYRLDGAHNELKEWQESTEGGVLIVQIQAGAEGIDLTKASRGVYYSLPYSLALYEQSLARLYRPGQTKDVQFTYLLAEDTIDESIYACLQNKKDLITEVQQGTIDFSYLKK